MTNVYIKTIVNGFPILKLQSPTILIATVTFEVMVAVFYVAKDSELSMAQVLLEKVGGLAHCLVSLIVSEVPILLRLRVIIKTV